MENSILHIKDFFKDLSFDEQGHKYFVKDKPIEYSVSGLIKKFHLPFDKYKISLAKSIELGIEQHELLKEWKKFS